MEKFYGVIYMITNQVNGKKYIGQTTKKINLRWNEHCSSSYCSKLSRAIKKYGKDSFSIAVFDHASSQKELNEKEILYIEKHGTIQHGYNIRHGGKDGKWNDDSIEKMRLTQKKKNAHKKIPVALLDGDFNTKFVFDSVKAMEIELGIKATPYLKLEKIKFRDGYIVYNLDKENHVNAIKDRLKKAKRLKYVRVNQICQSSNKILKEFYSIEEAAKAVGAYRSNIWAVCNGKKKSCKGFFWSFKKENF
jgi:group I intron endonuclease